MRATLHDELMHKAGFETDYDRELVSRRATRRRIAHGVASFAVPLGLFSGGLLLFARGHVGRGAALALGALSVVGGVCSLALGWPEVRRRSRLMRALTRLVLRVQDRLRWPEEGRRL